MAGADEVHYRRAVSRTGRLVRFPDGIVRHITLRNAQRDVLDRLRAEHGLHAGDIPAMAYEHAQDTCSDPAAFETELRRVFALYLTIGASFPMALDEANQNYPALPVCLHRLFNAASLERHKGIPP